MNRRHVLWGLSATSVLSLLGCDKETPESSSDPAASSDTADAQARIVSIGGGITETVFAIGAGDRVVGVDTSSLYPEAATKLPKVGYQRKLNAEGILALTPTLVIHPGEAGPPEVLEQLAQAGLRLESPPAPTDVESAKARITAIGELTGKVDGAKSAIEKLDADLKELAALIADEERKPKALFIYARGPNTVMAAGKNCGANTMLELVGAENVITEYDDFKDLGAESVIATDPEYIVVPKRGLESLGGVAGIGKMAGIAETTAAKNAQVVAIDDLALLGFGPRMGEAALELAKGLYGTG